MSEKLLEESIALVKAAVDYAITANIAVDAYSYKDVVAIGRKEQEIYRALNTLVERARTPQPITDEMVIRATEAYRDYDKKNPFLRPAFSEQLKRERNRMKAALTAALNPTEKE